MAGGWQADATTAAARQMWRSPLGRRIRQRRAPAAGAVLEEGTPQQEGTGRPGGAAWRTPLCLSARCAAAATPGLH